MLSLLEMFRNAGRGEAAPRRRKMVVGVLGAAAAAGIGLGIATALKNRKQNAADGDPPGAGEHTASRRRGHKVFANRVEMEDGYDYDEHTFIDGEEDDPQSRHRALDLPPHVERHPRFGYALQRLGDHPAVSPSHLRALVNHVDHLLRAQYALDSLKTTDSSRVARATTEVSYRRTKVMRRVVRLAYATGLPMHPDSNRVVDDSVQECLDEIRKGTDDLLHNSHLSSMDKFDASVFEQ